MPNASATRTQGLRRLTPLDANTRLNDLLSRPADYGGWEDVYRDQWTWDKVVKVTHAQANCISGCSLDAYIKDGLVWREEQNANYEHAIKDVPDFNPRGCAMGCAYSMAMYDPTRLKYPLKRVGERGAGRWERLTWEQAYQEIADKILDVIADGDSECLTFDNAALDFGVAAPMIMSLFVGSLGATLPDAMAGVGDLPTGLVQTWGHYTSEGTSDDWFLSDYILIWLGNPSYTRVADAHFMHEARYRGAKVVTIAPDYSPSTIHADRWLNVRMGTDAALSLGMIQVILSEELYDSAFIKEQTDLPFLVRDDNQRFLRESDLEEGGSDDNFYFWNGVTGRRTKARGTWGSNEQTIALEPDLDPQLEGAHRVRLRDGRRVTVRPVFELLQRRAAEYPPERVAEITGVAPGNIRRVAREFAAAKSAMIFASWGACKHYHSDLFQRGMAYLCALTGNTGGKPGSGVKVSSWWPPPNAVLMDDWMMRGGTPRLRTEPPSDVPIEPVQPQMINKMTFAAAQVPDRRGTPLLAWLYAHDAEWAKTAAKPEYNDPTLKRPVSEYMDEVLERGWMPVNPRPPKRPRFLCFLGVNPMRRWPNPQVLREGLWKGLETIVGVDIRMNSTTMWSDYILPACGYYEKPGIKYTTSFLPYVVVGEEAVSPLYESRDEWDIALGLAKEIQERARARGMENFTDRLGTERNLATVHDDLTGGGAYPDGGAGERAALDFIMRYSALTRASELGENAWKKASDAGMVKIEAIQPTLMGAFNSDYRTDGPVNQFGWFLKRKNPWPTLTGRQQFYIDHEWFLEVGEELLVHKEPLAAGGPFPLRLTGGHARWSVHSTWRASPQLLQLQRGEPVAYVSQADARVRGIGDHDRIRVYNEVGAFTLRAKVSPAVQPGTVICYHAWESYQFADGATQNVVAATPLKPTNMVGNYAHLHYRGGYYAMNHVPKEVAVDVEKVRDDR